MTIQKDDYDKSINGDLHKWAKERLKKDQAVVNVMRKYEINRYFTPAQRKLLIKRFRRQDREQQRQEEVEEVKREKEEENGG